MDHIQLSTELPGQSEIGSVLGKGIGVGGVAMSFQITILKVLAGGILTAGRRWPNSSARWPF